MSLRLYFASSIALGVLGYFLADHEPEVRSELGEKCQTPHRHACDEGLVCVRHRCAYPCMASAGSDCAPTPELAR